MLLLPSRKLFEVLIGVVVLVVTGITTVNANNMEGGMHDMTVSGGGMSMCSFCHTEHDSLQGQMALWNRTETPATFEPYSNPTMNANMAQPGCESLLCLSCHDGVTAFDALYGLTGTLGNNMDTMSPGSSAIIDPNLTDDHPIGVDITRDSLGIKHESVIRAGGLTVYDNKVECASCHDVHGRDGYAFFLRLDPSRGSLCLTCHNK